MRYIRGFGLFWYDFVVGDDWQVGVGVVVALGLAYLAARQGVHLWWLLPVATTLLLARSLVRAARSHRAAAPAPTTAPAAPLPAAAPLATAAAPTLERPGD